MTDTEPRELTLSDMGLKPLNEFNAAIAPLLKRLHAVQRKDILDDLYYLAGERVLIDFAKDDVKYEAKDMRFRLKALREARAKIKLARTALLAAQNRLRRGMGQLPIDRIILNLDIDGIIRHSDNVDRVLQQSEEDYAAGIHCDVKTKWEKTLPLPELFIKAGLPWSVSYPLKSRCKEEWFTAALQEVLPPAIPGKRSKFSRAAVIREVMNFLGLPAAEKTIARRIKKATANPQL